jgi:hypothetical protein
MFVLIASSCSQDDEAMDAAALAKEINSEIAAKGAKTANIGIQTNPTVYFSYSGSNIGGTDLTACLDDEIIVTFDINQNVSCGLSRIDMLIPSNTHVWNETEQIFEDIWTEKVVDNKTPVNGVVTYTFKVEEEGIYQFRGSYSPKKVDGVWCGENITGFVYGDNITVVDCTPCTNDLSVVLTCDVTRTATFTFTAEEAGPIVIQGGLSAGTTITSAICDDNVLTRNFTHHSVTSSNANVTRWEGNVDACQEVTITIEYSGGNGIGGWSAKRGDDTLGSTVAQSCN